MLPDIPRHVSNDARALIPRYALRVMNDGVAVASVAVAVAGGCCLVNNEQPAPAHSAALYVARAGSHGNFHAKFFVDPRLCQCHLACARRGQCIFLKGDAPAGNVLD